MPIRFPSSPSSAVTAETVALLAVAAIIADEDWLNAFLALSGADPADLRRRVQDPVFLGAVLDFILEEDRRVLVVAQAAGLAPEQLSRLRTALPGGEGHWS